MSVAEYKDDDEAALALKEHVRRATTGEAGGPLGQPAERIAAVYVYDQHPDSYNDVQAASADVLETEVSNLIKGMRDENDVIAIDQLAVAVRNLSHPMEMDRTGFNSFYKMKEARMLKDEHFTVAG
jgi:hypothetical protein